VKFSLEKGFKRSITYDFTDDARIEEIYTDHAMKYEFADITWYPSKHTAVYRNDNRVPLNTSGDGLYDFLGFQSNSVVVSKSVRTTGNASLLLSNFYAVFQIMSLAYHPRQKQND